MIRKELMVGDPHVTVEDLMDCEQLLRCVREAAHQHHVDIITFLGDLHHNHSLMNVKVVAFWREWFERLNAEGFKIRALVGNHDMPGDGQQYPHALLAYSGIEIVDKPVILDRTLYLPYFSEPNLFLEACKSHAEVELVVCHQEFNGAQYDNGFFAPNGADPSLVPQPCIISGHIHSPQNVGKIWYPGAPRWRILSDANVARAIHVLDIDDGEILTKTAIDTARFCRVIHSYTITPDNVILRPYNAIDEHRIRIEGPTDFIKQQEIAIKEQIPQAKIATYCTDVKAIRVRESDGISVAYRKYAEQYVPQFGTDKTVLSRLAHERIYG